MRITAKIITGVLVLLVALLSGATAAGARAVAGPETEPSRPNPVLYWSEVAERSIVAVARKPPGPASIPLAIVHAAMYDATVAVRGGYEPYAVRPRPRPDASLDAAVAAAARGALVGLFPAQQAELDAIYTDFLATIPDGSAETNGVALGRQVADVMLRLRADDGRDAVVPYEQAPPGPGVWEPTGPVPAATELGSVQPFVLTSPTQFRPGGPPSLTGRTYALNLNEVQRLGRVDSTERTTEQTATAQFWTEHANGQWSRALRGLASQRHLGPADAARMLTMAHVSSADALIACFNSKYSEVFWRPVHAIPRADTDGNPRTQADAGWTPLVTTPNHPEYPSAHSCLTAGITTALRAFFGTDRVPLTVDSAATGETHQFRRLSEVAAEVVDARVWAGLHFRESCEEGAALGRQVARWVTLNAFQPIR